MRSKKSQVKRYIAKKYMAADGGAVPAASDEDEEDDDSSSTDDTASPASAASVPANAPAADDSDDDDEEEDDSSPSDAAENKAQAMRDYLSKQYAAANDNSGVKQAQSDAKDTNFTANIGDALESIAKANSMAHGGAGVDSGFYQGLKAQGQLGVQNAMANKQASVQSFLQNNELQRQVLQDMVATGSFEQQQKANQILSDQNDPNSQVSQNAQTAFKTAFKGVPGINDMDVDSFSSNDLSNASKNVDVMAKLDEIKQMKQMQMGYQNSLQQNKIDAVDKATAVKQLSGLGQSLDTEAASSRTALGQAQNKVNGATKLMTFADTTPEELATAKADPAARAALTEKLNNLSPQQYGEVVLGLMNQLGSGGSLGQFEHLKTSTADQGLANIQQFFSSAPARAEAGPLIMNNLLTLKNEQATSQAVLDGHASMMQRRYPKAFSHPETAADAQALLDQYTNKPQSTMAQAPTPAPANGQASLMPAAVHPEANQAVQWANANPNDPRAAVILQRVGAMNAGL